ncbi:4'-phosphopantetheinyl transferase superfamily protein [Thermoleptolyngbya sp. PKUAC-SCTB121]|uniref:4'-phosphopantetheinyl transferase family protein n=1 Tax=Thermoleptolyngbya sp. PKUAC-SCTB121 TaxID=2811482 RepID=UPI001965982C|nr:4'-phosphopantetheinyl transferase superfamily protein [Thermoleptolyngbya sp. PKUAC-SCTB121]
MSFTVPKIAAIAPTWLSSSESAILSSEDVHLWLMNVESCAESLLLFEQILSPDEHARAAKFRQEGDRTRFIICRGTLRYLLSRYTGLSPAAIRFSYDSYGKPVFAPPSSETPPLQFNLSHAGGLVLYAFTLTHPIGVDLEQHRPLEVSALARTFFSEGERAFLSKFSTAEQLAQFFQLWTCKEAYLKAIGLGLSGLEQAEMAIAPNGSIRVPVFTDASSSDSHWQIEPMSLGNHFSSAFAVNKPAFNLYCYRLYAVQDLIQLISPSPTDC